MPASFSFQKIIFLPKSTFTLYSILLLHIIYYYSSESRSLDTSRDHPLHRPAHASSLEAICARPRLLFWLSW
jgi:hypothetical protein